MLLKKSAASAIGTSDPDVRLLRHHRVVTALSVSLVTYIKSNIYLG